MIRQTSKIMSFKRPFEDLSISELYQKLIPVIDYFESGNEITDHYLDMYLILKKRIHYLEKNLSKDELSIEEQWKRMYEE